MELDSLKELYIHELHDVYDAEHQLIKALPKMAKAASSEDLRQAFEHHLEETQTQVERLEKVFELIKEKAKRVTCKGMKGLIEEGEEMIKEEGDPAVKDAGLISAAQRVEHYEMAAYGCVRTYAEILGQEKAVKLLQTSLDEERAADQLLTDLAVKVINLEAAEA